MAEIRLGDYAGHVFLEMVRAREMADAYSRTVAERYAQDPVMRYFPAPRFRVPKMELSIPVLISGARFRQFVRFDFPLEEFVEFIVSRANGVRVKVETDQGKEIHEGPETHRPPEVVEIAHLFHRQLAGNPDPQHPEPIVTAMWARAFTACLRTAGLLDPHLQADPQRELLTRTTREVLDRVRRRTTVVRTEVESLLVDPETNVIENGGSETSVFTVTVELLEEGIFLRSVRDDGTGQTHTFVEFD